MRFMSSIHLKFHTFKESFLKYHPEKLRFWLRPQGVPEDSSCLSKSIPKTPDQGSCLIYIHASRMPRSWSPPLYGVNGRKVMLWQSCRVWVTAIPWRKTCQKTFLACIEVLSKRKWIGWTTFLLASCWLLHCLREKNKHGQWPTLFWTLGSILFNKPGFKRTTFTRQAYSSSISLIFSNKNLVNNHVLSHSLTSTFNQPC